MKRMRRKPRPTNEQLEEEIRRVRHRKRYKRVLRSTIYTLVFAAALAVLTATLWIPVLQVYGNSMTPTLLPDDIVISLKNADFETGDICAFYYNNRLLVKRVIAGPGDWVNIDDTGNVFVNGNALNEPYVQEKALGDCNIDLPFQVPEERYFVMGDDRPVSLDSRNTSIGCVSSEQIVGRIVFRVWPLRSFGAIH